jgi:ferric-dicitrate binding protein FerR (iron transport regulator)
MHDETESSGERLPDALAALVRAAGKRPAPPAEDYERVLAASRATWRAKVQSRRQRRFLYAVAASLAAVALIFGAVTRLSDAPPAASAVALQGRVEILSNGVWQELPAIHTAIPADTRLRTVADGRGSLAFEHGVSLRLDRATEVLIRSATRVELEAGALYFDSGADRSATAFEIGTPFGTVRDIGTQFEVRSLPDGLRVRVREGDVTLYRPGAPSTLATTAGEQLSIDSGGAIRRQPFATDDPDWDWITEVAQPPEVEGQTAYEVLRWVARESGRELRFADATAEQSARRSVLSGSGRGLTPLELLEIVVATAEGLDYELVPGAIVIRRR